MTATLDQFEREIDALVDAVPAAIAAANAALAGDAFANIVEASPVRTGEYRASHTIGLGSERTTSYLFEHGERPVPDAPAAPREVPIGPPDVSEAQASLDSIRASDTSILIENQKFYAGFLELGTAKMEPRLIYEGARVVAERSSGVAQEAFDAKLRELARL